MKEAAGEAILLPKLFTSMEMKSACSEMGGTLAGKKCTYKKSDGTETSCNVNWPCCGYSGMWFLSCVMLFYIYCSSNSINKFIMYFERIDYLLLLDTFYF